MKAKQENIMKEREKKLAQKQAEKERERLRQIEAKQAEKNRQRKQVNKNATNNDKTLEQKKVLDSGVVVYVG